VQGRKKSLDPNHGLSHLGIVVTRRPGSAGIVSDTDGKVPMTGDNGFSSRIDREIFNTGLSVEAISLYLLCCGLIDAGAAPTLEMLRSRWNESAEALQVCLDDLVGKGILRRLSTAGTGEEEFRPVKPDHWRL
jgi:hypothetical protein